MIPRAQLAYTKSVNADKRRRSQRIELDMHTRKTKHR